MTTSQHAGVPAAPGDPRPAGIGVIGLGVMGAPMAGHILRAGFPVHVSARRHASAEQLIAAGALWEPSPRSLAATCGVVVLMVPDLPDVEAVLDGPDGLLAGATAPMLVIISSTVSPEHLRRLDARVRFATDDRVHLVDAPVSGGQEGAEAGTLAVMLGGPEADAALARPVLEATGTVAHLGPLGAGQVAKACNQMIVAATVMALGEAAVVAERAGLDVAAMFDLLGQGYAGSQILEVKKARFAQHDHSPSGAARFMVKDLGFARQEAALSRTVTPQLDVLQTCFTDLTAQGFGDQDTSVVQAWIESLGSTG
ncbi:NAD(P)-dependent oxidoreductase [Tessaracoccus antarcticus]|uniref:NAD(P)-dependent oxidoreductase n=1 Tax=Tessaracoccus antarcticus TaxID=2479848 RepID=A0A3M0GXM6_9ACTN|nr:NAD(P)-dependent oxidoreductase [Tessaracoccus antarcticus]RMB62126.1 NAD(P)-dependent oxidoreductase [Tessaracoccus antarcticus]